MKTKYQKKNVVTIIFTLMLVLTISTAVGATSSGRVLDILIPKCDGVMEFVKENFPNSYSVSENSMLGKAGTVFIDMDKGEVRMIGEDIYRKYSFKEKDEVPFACCVGLVLYAVDNSSASDYGVNVYLVENKDTRLLEEKEISTLAAQFITALNN